MKKRRSFDEQWHEGLGSAYFKKISDLRRQIYCDRYNNKRKRASQIKMRGSFAFITVKDGTKSHPCLAYRHPLELVIPFYLQAYHK